jgi:hypothetical protein
MLQDQSDGRCEGELGALGHVDGLHQRLARPSCAILPLCMGHGACAQCRVAILAAWQLFAGRVRRRRGTNMHAIENLNIVQAKLPP